MRADRGPAADARAGLFRLRVRRQRPLRPLRPRLRQIAPRSGQQDIAQAKSLTQGGRPREPERGPAHHRRCGRHGGYGDGLREPGPAAGVKINVINDPNYYGNQYLKLALLDRLLGHPRGTSTRCSRAHCRTPRTTRRTGRRNRAPGPTSGRCTTRQWPPPTRPRASGSSTRCSRSSTTPAGTLIPCFGRSHRRLHGQGQGAQAQQGHPQPG